MSSNSKKKFSLLIAEDEPMLLEQLTEILSPLGYPIVPVRDGSEMFTEITHNSQITAVLSDINMPIISGLDVLKELRNKNIDLPVVFLTGYGDKELVVEALRLGALDFLDKPFDYIELRNAVQEAMKIGIQLKSLDEEVQSLAEKNNISEKNMEDYKIAQKSLLKMKIKNAVTFNKK